MNEDLFQSIGGSKVVDQVVDRFYQRVLEDDRINHFFVGKSMERILSMQKQLFAIALGAPLEFSGKSLIEVHKHLKLTREDVSIYIGHLLDTLTELKIDPEHANQFVARIATYADEVTGDTNVDGELR